MTKWRIVAKRSLDLTGSAIGLTLSSPLLLLIAVILKFDSPGRVIFRQARLGHGGKPFMILKFRTMEQNAPDLRNPDGSTFNGGDDPRVTRIGRLLRQTSLDELPQLFNVLNGSMSLVGPRPDQVDQSAYYTAEEHRKHLVKPGITGLAQIKGRNSISWSERKQLDLEYVSRQSLRFDLRILAQTFPYVLERRDVFVAPSLERSL